MSDEDFEDDLKKRRRKLIEASHTPRTKEEIQKALSGFKSRNLEIIIDDKECTITRTFEAMIGDNNKKQTRTEVSLTVSGNLHRPIEDFVHDMRWLQAQAGSIQEAQKGIISRR